MIGIHAAFFLSVVILADSMLIFLDESKEANAWDYEISINGFTSAHSGDQWMEHTDYINQVDYALRLPINISADHIEEEVMIIGVSDLSDTFHVGIDFVETHGIYISEYIAESLQLDKDKWIEITIPSLSDSGEYVTETIIIEVLGIHHNPMGLYTYADIEYIYEITQMIDLANVFYLDTTTGRIPIDVQNDIATTLNVASVTYILDQEKFIDEMFDMMLGMIFMMVFISAILMLAIIYNISMINVSEKSREYATMKTLGTSIRRISYLIIIENIFTLVGGIGTGFFLGYIMAVGMLKGTDVLEGFTFNVILSFQWFLVGVIMVTAVICLVIFLTLRFIKKIVIADVIRERTTG